VKQISSGLRQRRQYNKKTPFPSLALHTVFITFTIVSVVKFRGRKGQNTLLDVALCFDGKKADENPCRFDLNMNVL